MKEKTCSRCQATKPLSDFYAKPSGKYGVESRCKDCAKALACAWYEENADRSVVSKRIWQNGNKERILALFRKRTYGVTPEQVDAMLVAQSGRCAICCGAFQAKGSRGPHLDHDHNTRAVRGLLCRACNGALGWYERPGVSQAVAEYLAATHLKLVASF